VVLRGGQLNQLLKKIGKKTGATSNRVSVVRVPIHFIGMALLRIGFVYLGTAILAFSWMLDNTDGRLARANGDEVKDDFEVKRSWKSFKLELEHHGKTSIGKWIDPMMDKIKTLSSIGRLVFEKVFDWKLYLVMFIADLVGTLIRPPFMCGERYQLARETWLSKTSATWLGKVKTTCQFSAIGAWGFEYVQILNPSFNTWGFECLEILESNVGLSDAFFSFAVVFSLLSLLSKLNRRYIWFNFKR